jgi:chromosomal replication initiator protein
LTNPTTSSQPSEEFRRLLQHSVTQVTWQTWLQPLRPTLVESTLRLDTPSEFHRRWVAERHLDIIERAAHDAFGPGVEIELAVDASLEPAAPPRNGHSHPTMQPAPSTPEPLRIPAQDVESRLISKYTFEHFVVGPSNRFAHAAAMAVAETPGGPYNPLLIYGDAGLGKTHLLHAVGHHCRELAPGTFVRYVSSEQFFNEFINGIRRKEMTEFKARYRTIDVLLLDDVQFFEGKEQILEEFFHTFNSLYEAGKQIVISSDRDPRHLSTLEDRLRSRFAWGLITDIQAPDVETRYAILRRNAEFAPKPVPADVLQFIADNVHDNIRELEGALTRVTAYGALTHETITLEMAMEVLQHLVPPTEHRPVTADMIIDRVGTHFHHSRDQLLGPSRKQPLARDRQIAMFLCRELTDMSLPKVGAAFGDRDHTTVLHAVDRINGLMQRDRTVLEEVTTLCQQLKNA